jgi:hypothetical protein
LYKVYEINTEQNLTPNLQAKSEGRKTKTKFWFKNLMGRVHLQYLGQAGTILNRKIQKEVKKKTCQLD